VDAIEATVAADANDGSLLQPTRMESYLFFLARQGVPIDGC
jgi:hypothetical protein